MVDVGLPRTPCCTPGSETKSVLSPDPAPGLLPTLPSRPGRSPRLHLAPGFCLQNCQCLGIHHPPACPHLVVSYMEKVGTRTDWPWTPLCMGGWGGLTPGLHLLPPTWACQGGAPCQPKWGLSLCLTAPQLLACYAIINVYVCRWPEPLCLLCYLAWTAGILGDCEKGDPSKASCWCLTQG